MNEEDDRELLAELRRVGSDLGFRKWARRRIFLVAALVVLDLLLSVGVVAALIGIRHVQHEACQRDNRLRAAYVDQWTPILVDAPPPVLPPNPTAEQQATYDGQIRLRTNFQSALDTDFAQHDC